MGFFNSHKTIEELEEENIKLEREVSLEEKRALIRRAKERYGRDWTKFFSKFGSGSGINWNEVKFKLSQ